MKLQTMASILLVMAMTRENNSKRWETTYLLATKTNISCRALTLSVSMSAVGTKISNMSIRCNTERNTKIKTRGSYG